MHDPLGLSQLNPEEHSLVSELCEHHRTQARADVSASCESLVEKLPDHVRVAGFAALLEVEISTFSDLNHGMLPTPYYLRQKYSRLESLFDDAYQRQRKEFQVPHVIGGKYLVTRMIKRGGQSQVFVAGKVGEKGDAIVKLALDRANSQRLKFEAQLLRQLSEVSVPRVLDVDSHENRTALILQCYDGRNLQDYVRKENVSPAEVVELIAAATAIVNELHRRGIAHCDIKPENFHRDLSGKLRLLDLGMAIEFSQGHFPLEKVVPLGGTPAYMAPELIQGKTGIDGELVDVYALGGTLYFLLTKMHPAGDFNYSEWESNRPRDCSPMLWDICREAMHPIAAERTPTVESLLQKLEAFADQREAKKRRKKQLQLTAVVAGGGTAMFMTMAFTVLCTMLGIWYWWVQPSRRDVLRNAIQNRYQSESGIQSLGDAMNIDLDAISADSFEVAVTIDHPFSRQQRNSPIAYPARLSIVPNHDLMILAAFLEYRVGWGSWAQVPLGDGRNLFAPLNATSITSSGPVELRFRLEHDANTFEVIGPYRFDLDVASEYARLKKARNEQSKKDVGELAWLERKEGLWAPTSELLAREDIAKEIVLGASPDKLNHRFNVHNLQQKYMATYNNRWNRNAAELIESIGDLAEGRFLYAQLDYTDGTKSQVRRIVYRNHFGHDGSVTEAKRMLKDNIDAPLAIAGGERLYLERIAQVGAAIDHLRIGYSAVEPGRVVSVAYTDSLPSGFVPNLTKVPDYEFRDNYRRGTHQSTTIEGGICMDPIAIAPCEPIVYIQIVYQDGSKTGLLAVENQDMQIGVKGKVVSNNSEDAPDLYLRFEPNSFSTEDVSPFLIPPKDYDDVLYLHHTKFNRWFKFSAHADGESGRWEATCVFRHQNGKELGPYVYAFEPEAVHKSFAKTAAPTVQSFATNLVIARRFNSIPKEAVPFKDLHVRNASTQRLPGLRVLYEKAPPYSMRVGVFSEMSKYKAVWAAIQAVKIGHAKDEMGERIPVVVPSESLMFQGTYQEPYFAELLPNETKLAFVAFQLVDGTWTEPISIPVEDVD